MAKTSDILKSWRVVVLIVMVLLSVLLVSTKGLSYGIDFTGGTELKMELEQGGEAYADPVVEILKNRLNGMGLKSTQVLKEADNRHITIKVSSTDPADLANLKNVINQQAIFEQMVEGDLCAAGDEIQLNTNQQGGAFISGNSWQVYVKTTGAAPERCGQAMEGKAGKMTDIFLDRPRDAVLLTDSGACDELSAVFSNHPEDTSYTMLSFIEDRALTPVVCYASAKPAANDSILSDIGLTVENGTSLDVSAAVRELTRLAGEGKKTVILSKSATSLPQGLQDAIASLGLSVKVYDKAADQPYQEDGNADSWIQQVFGLKSTLRIEEGLTNGNPVYESVFTGGSSTSAEAKSTVENFKIWLTSGNLPVKLSIVLERPNLPELGQEFLKYAFLTMLVAIILVSAVIAIRYREPKISGLIIVTCLSEAVIILGFASVSSWELDMAAIAGIIAAIGTGVDHQIIITDETLRGEGRKRKDAGIWDLKQSIDRAFFMIFTSAATIAFAMLPLMSLIDLRGFAFTTIIGVLIGIFITRPAYARVVEMTMK